MNASLTLTNMPENWWHYFFYWQVEQHGLDHLGLGRLELYGKYIEEKHKGSGRYVGAHKAQSKRMGKWKLDKDEFDILCVSGNGNLVCIEMKNVADTRGAGQALKYLNNLRQLSRELGMPQPIVVFVCREINDHFRCAYNEMPENVKLYIFHIEDGCINLTEVEKEVEVNDIEQ